QSMIGVDEACSLATEAGREQPGQGYVHERGIADVAVSVGEREPRRLEIMVPLLHRALVRDVEVAQDVERLTDGRTAAGRGRHRVHVVAAVIDVRWVARDRAVAG